ncbi:VanZ family protein [Belliella kenyensis]|nr:VanZ family protein [Belliella kenyensis]MCH7400648.1 VanZ family protein [Belliella kenyensis]MDN3602065.1 VanZ family protein [Belliella kenyensis]
MLRPGDKLPKAPNIPHIDKIAHFGLFFVLIFLWLRIPKKKNIKIFFTIYLVFGVLFAILVEYLQGMVPMRSFDYMDITANILGVTVGVICFYILYKYQSRLV